ncbi:MAG: VTT domain-containing protein [Treponema sp.]|nr:VTT domain-containing protein [Treponema sp.]
MEKAKKRSLIFLIVFLGFTGILGLIFLPIIGDLQSPENREAISAWVASLGHAGVIVFFFILLLQNLTAVFPVGGLLQIVSGAAFGLWAGYFIILSSFIASSIIIFPLVRKFAGPLITRLLGDDLTNTWAFLKNEKTTSLVIFVLFFIPGLPKDTMTYLTALTKFPLAQFLPVAIVARFPAMFSGALMGDAVMQGNWLLFILLFGFTAIAGLLGILFRERIIKRLRAG